MPVLPIKTELKCKLCASEHRAEIDALLEKRSKGEADSEGRRYNFEHVRELVAGLGVQNPTKENFQLHFKKHCEVVTEKEAQKRQVDTALDAAKVDERVRKLVGDIVGPEYFDSPRLLTPDESLQVVQALGVYNLIERVRKGENVGVTIDHLLKGIDGTTRRKSSEATDELKQGLGKALTAWAEQKAIEAPKPQAELDVVDVEAVEVESESALSDEGKGRDGFESQVIPSSLSASEEADDD